MMKILNNLLKNFLSKFNLIADLTTKNLALQQQVIVLKRLNKRPQILDRDRLFWILLSKYWNNWQDALIIVKPDTVVRWHKKGFKSFWKWKSQSKRPGRPPVDKDVKKLVLEMSKDNPVARKNSYVLT